MAGSEVEIANSALILVGAEPINTLSDTNSKEARLCNRLFADLRDRLLAHHPWNFAIKRAELAQTSTTPVFGFDFSYQRPSDCLRILDSNLGDEKWAEESDEILANFSNMKIKYIAKVTDVSKWSQGFEEAFAYKMALYLAPSLSRSSALTTSIKQDYLVILRDAKSQDAQASGVTQIEADEWLNSRF